MSDVNFAEGTTIDEAILGLEIEARRLSDSLERTLVAVDHLRAVRDRERLERLTPAQRRKRLQVVGGGEAS